MMKKIGIFGGTFNPPHRGHVKLAVNAADSVELDRVIVIPDCIPPHKEAGSLASAQDRLRMCELSFCADKRFEISPIEINRGSKSYTVETLRELKKEYPDDELYLIIGSDMLETFTEWFCWEEILTLARIIAASREEGFVPRLEGFSEEQKKRVIYIDEPPFEMSSSAIRSEIWKSDKYNEEIDDGVLALIRRKGLYASGDERLEYLLTTMLDEKRIHHSRCVSEAAVKLAERYSADCEKARTAGLMHDIMKNASPAAHIAFAPGMTGVELANRKVWHQFSGEGFLRLNGIITDEEILGAVKWHTTGRAGMTLLEKVVYIADFISADRDYEDVEVVRRLADISLEHAILYTSRYTVEKLVSSDMVIHPATLDCYNDMLLFFRGRKGNNNG